MLSQSNLLNTPPGNTGSPPADTFNKHPTPTRGDTKNHTENPSRNSSLYVRQLTPVDLSRLESAGRFDQSLLPRILSAQPTLNQALTNILRLAAASVIRPLISQKPSEIQLTIMRAALQLYSLFTAYGISRMMGYLSDHQVTNLAGLPCKHYAPSNDELDSTDKKPLVILAFPGFGGICNTPNGWDAPLMNLQKATGAHVLAFQYPNMNDTIRGQDQVKSLHNALEHLGDHPLFKNHCDAQGHPIGFRFASVANSYGGLMLASVLQTFAAEQCPIKLECSVFQWPFMRIDRAQTTKPDQSPARQNPHAVLPSGAALEAFSAHVRGENAPGNPLLNPLMGTMDNFSDHNLLEIGTEDPVAADGEAFAHQLGRADKKVDLIIHDPGFHGGEMTTNWLPWGDSAMARAAGFIKSHTA